MFHQMVLNISCLDLSEISPVLSEAVLADIHVLVGHEEAEEGRHLVGLDHAGFVDIKVGEGLVKVFVEISLLSLTCQAHVGREDLLGGESAAGVVEVEVEEERFRRANSNCSNCESKSFPPWPFSESEESPGEGEAEE